VPLEISQLLPPDRTWLGRTGACCAYISRDEDGHTVPAVETLEKLARALEVPTYQLFYDGEEPPKLPNSVFAMISVCVCAFFGAKPRAGIRRESREPLSSVPGLDALGSYGLHREQRGANSRVSIQPLTDTDVEKLSIPCANRGVFAEFSLAQQAQLVHASAELLFALFRKFWFEL